ncbi:hypothetical protein GIB67_012235, partial [Kingdonia uniflora]
NQRIIVSTKEQTLEVIKTKDEASQASADQRTVISIEEQTIEVTQTEVVIIHQEKDVGEASQVIHVYIKALIQHFGVQYRTCPDKERVVLADVFASQYIGRDFNDWTRNMSSPEGVKLKKKSIWEQIISIQWDRTVFNCFNRRDINDY